MEENWYLATYKGQSAYRDMEMIDNEGQKWLYAYALNKDLLYVRRHKNDYATLINRRMFPELEIADNRSHTRKVVGR